MNLSIIVPAYNEEKRIRGFLRELVGFLKGRGSEIIVVNDGSTDNTLGVLGEFGKDIRIISYKRNRGKGAAVKRGIMESRGEKIIFMDADGATPPGEIPKMERMLDEYDVATGLRTSRESRILRKQPFHRVFLSRAFNRVVGMLFHIGVDDYLCGFKGFRRQAARELAGELVSDRWEFDVELMARARRKGFRIKQFPITWSDVKGSKLSSFRDPASILFHLVFLKFRTGL